MAYDLMTAYLVGMALTFTLVVASPFLKDFQPVERPIAAALLPLWWPLIAVAVCIAAVVVIWQEARDGE